MDDLCFNIDIVLNECSRFLCKFEKEELHESSWYKIAFKIFINGPLLQFVKSIQIFLKTLKCKNIYMLYVCLSQIRKCLLIHETITLEQNTELNFEKVLSIYLIKWIQKCFYKLEDYLEMLDLTNLDEHPGIFIDQMNIVLNGLSNKKNFELIKPNIDKIIFQAITIAKVSDKVDNLELTSSSKLVLKTIQNFEKVNTNKTEYIFQFDCLASSLSILERQINTAVLNLIYKIFNDPFCTIKKIIQMCKDSVDIQLRNSSDLSSIISDLDYSTDVLIQIGLFSMACCKNNDYVIPLKCCISSLELLDSDMVPAIIEFYLDPASAVKKKFLKLLVNHWVCEICEIQNILYKIIDPFAFAQITLETSMNFIDTIHTTDLKTNAHLYMALLNGLINFKKYMDKIFVTEMYNKNNKLFTNFEQFKNALKEYKACLIFNKNTSHDYYNELTSNKLLKRCKIVLNYLKNIQNSIIHSVDSLSELENTCYILSKTKQSSKSCISYTNVNDNDDLDLMISTIQVQKSFYDKKDRTTLKQFHLQDYCLNTVNETTYGNTVVMDLTSKYNCFKQNKNNIGLNGTNNYVLRHLR